jgi:hypothetical protein
MIEKPGWLHLMARRDSDRIPGRLRGFSLVVAQHATETVSALDWPTHLAHFRLRRNQPIVEALMIAFCVIMRQVLSQRITQ